MLSNEIIANTTLNNAENPEAFFNELNSLLEHLQSVKTRHPNLFASVLPEGEDLRLPDAQQALETALYRLEEFY